ncbi:hypothetical protein Mth01_01630 [Sphaerimonospora thailandensis]|uniref:Uncharacterized protein n=1 Tax=Sphaerimonospora thailandensis TaxID=795644 RepID=A0A8J3VXH8_9ACTN|nr:hypothetical protein Mth01_01630 [Sphaerimonospora thailandensis]
MAGVLGVAVIPVPAAQAAPVSAAAPVDVVAAVQRLKAQGSPVKVFQHTSVDWPHDPRGEDMPRGYCRGGGTGDPWMTGTARLGRGGVVAADMKRSMRFGKCTLQFLREDAAAGDRRAGDLVKLDSAIHRVRSVGGVLYGAGPAYGGKSWMKIGKRSGGAALYGDQIIDVFDLGTLKALVASATHNKPGSAVHDADDRAIKKTWSYRGTTTFGKLFEMSKPFRTMLGGRLDPRFRGITVLWGIATDLTGKPIVVQADWRPREGHPADAVSIATRFSWDVKASITAPRTNRTGRDPYGDDVIDLYRS